MLDLSLTKTSSSYFGILQRYFWFFFVSFLARWVMIFRNIPLVKFVFIRFPSKLNAIGTESKALSSSCFTTINADSLGWKFMHLLCSFNCIMELKIRILRLSLSSSSSLIDIFTGRSSSRVTDLHQSWWISQASKLFFQTFGKF